MSTAYTAQTDEYLKLHDDGVSDAETRKASYATLANHYYDLVTDFYLFGWGESFHFSRRYRGESFAQATLRHQMYLAARLDLRPGMRVADLGCGVGGPMRAIAKATGAHVIGINNNDYQLERGRKFTTKAGLSARCEHVKADFMHLPFADGELDACYAIEATVHAPDRTALFSEIRRVLKPGGLFASYEWCMTDAYDPANAEHVRIKRSIERGDGLPDMEPLATTEGHLVRAGLEVVALRDLALDSDAETPWYMPLTGKDKSFGSLTRRPLVRALTKRVVAALERIKVAPEGASRVSGFLNEAADALVEGGEAGIFTPMGFLLAKKPLRR